MLVVHEIKQQGVVMVIIINVSCYRLQMQHCQETLFIINKLIDFNFASQESLVLHHFNMNKTSASSGTYL